MTNIILNGACGKMGRVITKIVSERDDCKITAGVDKAPVKYDDFEVYDSISKVTEPADVIIDFSHPSALSDVLGYAVDKQIGAVIATTGLDEQHIAMVNDAAKKTAVFFTYNMSLGVNLLAELAKKASYVLGDSFDIEIIEAHHNQKIDAPSGTALMLADAVEEPKKGTDDSYYYEFDRHSRREKRNKREIGIHAIRGGNIVGEHTVMFAGHDEIITLSHSARSKEVFAVGAVNAAVFISGKGAGLYNMSDLVANR